MTQSPLRCHLLIGPPGSGKTTLAHDLAPLRSDAWDFSRNALASRSASQNSCSLPAASPSPSRRDSAECMGKHLQFAHGANCGPLFIQGCPG
jgi:SpoVK/Ycf46/Vps4 family AAA+-type ATPase